MKYKIYCPYLENNTPGGYKETFIVYVDICKGVDAWLCYNNVFIDKRSMLYRDIFKHLNPTFENPIYYESN